MIVHDQYPILTDFVPIQLSEPKEQRDVLNYTSWLIAARRCVESGVCSNEEAERALVDATHAVWSYGVVPEFIQRRQLTALPADLGAADGNPALPEMFSIEHGTANDLKHKMLRHREISRQVFAAAYRGESARPSSVIHVTCAGYVSPSSAQEFVSEQSWSDINVTHSYHMGCYGAFPPVRMACGYLSNDTINPCAKPERRVDIVHTEVLSLHGDYSNAEPGALVTLTLFADGFIKYSVVQPEQFAGRRGLQVVAQYETIIPGTAHEMTWVPSGQLFEMYLSKAVPLHIKQSIRPFVSELCRRSGIDYEREKDQLFFAIHPGGPKILDHIRDQLAISDAQMHWSRDVLNEHGNMSSATVPHIWSRMLQELPRGSVVVSMAFGPGLTATGLVLRVV